MRKQNPSFYDGINRCETLDASQQGFKGQRLATAGRDDHSRSWLADASIGNFHVLD